MKQRSDSLETGVKWQIRHRPARGVRCLGGSLSFQGASACPPPGHHPPSAADRPALERPRSARHSDQRAGWLRQDHPPPGFRPGCRRFDLLVRARRARPRPQHVSAVRCSPQVRYEYPDFGWQLAAVLRRASPCHRSRRSICSYRRWRQARGSPSSSMTSTSSTTAPRNCSRSCRAGSTACRPTATSSSPDGPRRNSASFR